MILRIQEIDCLYRSDVQNPSCGVAQNTTSLLQSVIDDIPRLAAKILEFQAFAVRHTQRNEIWKLVNDTVKRDDWATLLKKIFDEESRLFSSVIAREICENQKDRIYEQKAFADIEERDRALQKLLFDWKEEQKQVELLKSNAIRELTQQQAEQQLREDARMKRESDQEYLGRLGQYELEYGKERSSPRVEGTCEWFKRHEWFDHWKTKGQILWVSADPGAGKSVLAKHLIDDVLPAQTQTLCWFFFKAGNANTETPIRAVYALIRQLLTKNRDLLDDDFKDSFDQYVYEFVDSFKRLWAIFESLVVRTGHVTCVLDALDECQDKNRKELITSLIVLSQKKTAFKCLLTSRPYSFIKHTFGRLLDEIPELHLQGEGESVVEGISDEIKIVVRSRIKSLGNRNITEDEQQFLLEHLEKKVGRTYLWVTLVLSIIENDIDRGLFTKGQAYRTISQLPVDVSNAYKDILERSPDIAKARKLLQIMLVAKSPLFLVEASLVLAIDENHTSFHGINGVESNIVPEERFRETVRQICGLFVVVIGFQLYFFHETARDFLLSSFFSIGPPETSLVGSIESSTTCHKIMTEVCVHYLSLTDIASPHCSELFLKYAAVYWDYHFVHSRLQGNEDLVRLAANLCDPRSTNFQIWTAKWWKGTGFLPKRSSIFGQLAWSNTPVTFFQDEFSHACDSIHVAAFLGLTSVVALRLNDGINPRLRDRRGRTALDYAINYYHILTPRHESTARLLLKRGVSINEPDNRGETLLFRVTRRLHEVRSPNIKMVAFLLEQGASPIGKFPERQSPILNLLGQIQYDYIEQIKLLIDHQADIDMQDKKGFTPLMIAVHRKDEDMTRLLLEKGANTGITNSYSETSLEIAASLNSIKLVRLLLQHGAEPNAQDSKGQTALMRAVTAPTFFASPKAVVTSLLDNGANVNLRNDKLESALTLASRLWKPETALLLLKRGADIDVEDWVCRTPLIIATTSGNGLLVETLLKHGAAVNRRDKDGCTALHFAMRQNNSHLVGLLLDYGADASLENNEGQAPVAFAYPTRCRQPSTKRQRIRQILEYE